MEMIYARCAGVDVHKRNVLVCVLTPGVDKQARKKIRTFSTMTEDILALAYWKPLYNLL